MQAAHLYTHLGGKARNIFSHVTITRLVNHAAIRMVSISNIPAGDMIDGVPPASSMVPGVSQVLRRSAGKIRGDEYFADETY